MVILHKMQMKNLEKDYKWTKEEKVNGQICTFIPFSCGDNANAFS